MKRVLSGRELLYRAPLGIPWATLCLIASCLLVSAPLFVEPRRFYMTIGVGYCEEDAVMYWYHPILTHFVHGMGCGFPPAWLHLAINTGLFLFQGAVVERVLGSGRFALLTVSNLIIGILLTQWLVDGRSHGASAMSWSYGLFTACSLYSMWQAQRGRMFRDPVTCVMVLFILVWIAGMIVRWHVFSALVSVPFFLAWRRLWHCSRERRAWDRVGVVLFGALLAFNVAIVVLIIARVLP